MQKKKIVINLYYQGVGSGQVQLKELLPINLAKGGQWGSMTIRSMVLPTVCMVICFIFFVDPAHHIFYFVPPSIFRISNKITLKSHILIGQGSESMGSSESGNTSLLLLMSGILKLQRVHKSLPTLSPILSKYYS